MARAALRRYLSVLGALVLAGLIVLAAVGVYRHFYPPVPAPPEIPPGLDPLVHEAIENARAEVLAHPRAANVWGHLGMIFVAHEFSKEGIACFEVGENLDRHEPRWPYLLGVSMAWFDLDAALPHLRLAVERGGDRPPALRVRLAGFLLQRGHLAEAEEHYRAALQAAPDPWAELGLARLLHQRGDWHGSLEHLNNSVRSPYTRKASRALLAEVHQRLNDQADAEEDLRQLQQLPADLPMSDPFVEELYRTLVGMKSGCNRATALLNDGRASAALTLLDQLTRQYPNEELPWLTLGSARAQLGNLEGAEEALRTATRLAPDSIESQYALGSVLHHRFKRAEAAACFRRVVQLKPDFAEGYHNLATCLERTGDRAGAIEALTQAVRCNPYSILFLQELCALLAEDGRSEETAACRRRIDELQKGQATAERAR